MVDFGTWVLPLVLLWRSSRRALGIADRFVHYVVASNWASALIVWLMLPAAAAAAHRPVAATACSSFCR